MQKPLDELTVKVEKSLKEDEVVLWAGRPTGIKLMDAPYGNGLIIRWIVCLVILAFAIWYALVFAAGDPNNSSGNVVLVICAIVAVFLATRPLFDINTITKKSVYYITNQRAIVLQTGTPIKLKDKVYSEIDDISFELISGNRGVIYIGQKQPKSFQKSRGETLTFPQNPDDMDRTKPLIFYSVENPQEIIEYFPEITETV